MRSLLITCFLFVALGLTGCVSDSPVVGVQVEAPSTPCPAGHPPQSRGSIHGGAGDDTIIGGTGLVHGDEDNDRIYGGREPIQAFGDDGRDFIDGGPAADDITGGPGQDILIGELGADRFIYDQVADSPADRHGRWSPTDGDTIVDFSGKDADRLDLSRLPTVGPRAVRLTWSDAKPRAYGVWTGQRAGDTVVYVDTNGDRRPDLAVRLLGTVSLSINDFCGVG